MTERREPGQEVSLTEKEHLRQAFYTLLSALVIGGIFAMTNVWSETKTNTKDIQRHENQLSEIGKALSGMQGDLQFIRGQFEKNNDRRQ